jgi:hypothetical protein
LKVEIKLVQTWGDVHYIGLNGIEFLDENGRIVSVSPNRVACNCNSMDIRTHDNLMNGKNITLDDRNMWLAPFMNSPSEQFKINGNNPSFGELAAPRNLNSLVFTFE